MAANFKDFILSEQFKRYFTDLNKKHFENVFKSSMELTDLPSKELFEQQGYALMKNVHAASVSKSFATLFQRKPEKTLEQAPDLDNSPKKKL